MHKPQNAFFGVKPSLLKTGTIFGRKSGMKPLSKMKPDTNKKQKVENMSKFKTLIRNLFESFIRKTDSEKRSDLFGADPFRH